MIVQPSDLMSALARSAEGTFHSLDAGAPRPDGVLRGALLQPAEQPLLSHPDVGGLNTAVDSGNASQTDSAEADDAPLALQAFERASLGQSQP
jgi:hypothetical protein